MKKLMIMALAGVTLLLPIAASAQTQPPSQSTLPGKASSSLDQSKENPFETAPPEKSSPKHMIVPKVRPTTTAFSTPYTLPGIVGLAGGKWIGSDNLYNMRPDISVYVEVIMPEGKVFKINETALKELVIGIFEKGMINSPAVHEPDEPSLPLFHILIMMNSIDQYTIANIDCRLFESVTLKRVILDPGITFQAITWEKQELIAATETEFNNVFTKTIQDLATTFSERLNYFQTVKARMNN
jgi:hypothetical protein